MTDTASEKVVATGKMEEFVSWIESISVLELSKLVKVLEDRLGVSAAAPVAVAAVAGAAAGGAAAAPAEEKTEFTVVLGGRRPAGWSGTPTGPPPRWSTGCRR